MILNRLRFIVCLCIAAMLRAGTPARADNEQSQLAKLIALVEPSVVTIEVLFPGEDKAFAFNGSGFVVSADGIIATCFHVVEGAEDARIKLRDGKTVELAGFVAVSAGKDIVLLKAKSPEKLPPLKVAGKLPGKGDPVVAFGAPKGLAGSVSNGIVSAVRKGLEVRDVLKETTGKDVYLETLHYDLDAVWIQTTAPISGGNSGGPLINDNGEVLGINTWVRQGGQNINFAVAASFVVPLLAKLEAVPRPFEELPVVNGGDVPALANAKKTLAYWAKLNEAKQDRADTMSRIRTLDKRATSKQRAKAALETAKAWRRYFEEVKAASVDGVDVELLALATLDAQYSEKMTNALQTVIQLYDASKPREAATAFRAGCGGLAQPLVKIQDSYDFLRIALNARYDLDFPAMRANAALVQDDRDAKEAREQERTTTKTLAIGKEFLNHPDKRKRAAAKSWFEKVVSQYPGTAAAAEAARLLEKMK